MVDVRVNTCMDYVKAAEWEWSGGLVGGEQRGEDLSAAKVALSRSQEMDSSACVRMTTISDDNESAVCTPRLHGHLVTGC